MATKAAFNQESQREILLFWAVLLAPKPDSDLSGRLVT